MALCKCDRCGRIREAFQYTKFEVKYVSWVENAGKDKNGDVIRRAIRNNVGEQRALCEECAVELNKRYYDERITRRNAS